MTGVRPAVEGESATEARFSGAPLQDRFTVRLGLCNKEDFYYYGALGTVTTRDKMHKKAPPPNKSAFNCGGLLK